MSKSNLRGIAEHTQHDSAPIDADYDIFIKEMVQEELEMSNPGRRGKGNVENFYEDSFKSQTERIIEEKGKLSGRDVMKEILASVAMEERSIASLIQAESDKIRAFTGSDGNFPTVPTNQQINEFQNGIARVIEALVEKQKLLVRLVAMSKHLLEEGEDDRVF
ncbi:hypothetical protein EBB07_17375 [Paenibacillaceae bacterium]|nr:hypothetical protein EBB07_17375 [Paenibacillaceae bacterium]